MSEPTPAASVVCPNDCQDGTVACWNPGGPCPTPPPCESCGPCLLHPDPAASVAFWSHPAGCSCAVPCRSCGHESEQHAGSLYGGSGPRRCAVTGCKCKGAYIGSTPARCKQGASDG